MAIDLRLPNITSKSTEGKTEQLKSYIYQLVQELNWALNAVLDEAKNSTADDSDENNPKVIFNKIKPLIMNSKDIMDSFYYSIKTKYGDDYTQVEVGKLTAFAEGCRNGVTNIQMDAFPGSLFDDIAVGSVQKFGNYIIVQLTSTSTGVIAEMHYKPESQEEDKWSNWRYLIPSDSPIGGGSDEV